MEERTSGVKGEEKKQKLKEIKVKCEINEHGGGEKSMREATKLERNKGNGKY